MAATAASSSVMAFSAAAPPAMVGFIKTLCASSTSLLSPTPSPTSFLSLQTTSPSLSAYPSVVCGRGDKRTAKGKRKIGSYGNSRPRNANKGRGLPELPLPSRPPKKDPLDDGEFIEIVIDDNLFKKKV